MALGYNIRFIMSVQNNTRNGMNRVISDMRRMSKAEKDLALATQHHNMMQREASKETTNLQRRLKKQVSDYNSLHTAQGRTRKSIMQQRDAVVKYTTALSALEAREASLKAQRLKTGERFRTTKNPVLRAAARLDLKSIQTNLNALPAQMKLVNTQLRRAEREQGRLNKLQMQQLAGLKLNKKEQLEILGLLEKQAIAEARILAEEERIAALQAKRDARFTSMNRGRVMADTGRAMQLRGLLVGAGAGYVANYAAQYQTQVTKAATQIRTGTGSSPTQAGIATNSAKLSKDILDMMGQFPAKAQEMTDSAYQIFSSMNVGYQAGIDLLEVFNALAVAGATDLKTATSAGITLFNNFGGTAEQNAKILDQTFAIIRLGRMEFEDFNQMLNQVAPAAKQAGQSLEDVGGAMAFLTTRMPSQRMAGTALARLMEIYSRSDFRAGMQKLGKSIEDDQHNLLSLPEILKKVASLKIAQSDSGLSNLIPYVTMIGRGRGRGIEATAQGRRAQAFLIKDQKDYLAIQKQINQSQKEFKARYEAMLGTPQVQWQRFLSLLQSLAIQFGNYLIPAMVRFAALASVGVQWVKLHQGLVKTIALATGAFAAISLLGGMFLNIAGSIRVLAQALMLGVGSSGMEAAVIGLSRIAVVLGVVTTAAYGLKEVWDNLWSKDFEGNTAQKWTRGIVSFFKGAMKPLKLAGGPLGAAAKYNETIMDQILKSETLTGTVTKKKGSKLDWKKKFNTDYNDIMKALRNAQKSGYNKKVMNEWMKAMGLDPVAFEKFRNSNGDTNSTAARLAKSIKDQTREITKQVRDALEGVYKELQSANETVMGDIFQGRWLNSDKFKYFEQFGVMPKMGDLIQDAQVQIQDFKTSQKVFGKLRKRGISEAFIQDLKAMGPEGYKYIKALLNGSDAQLKKYVALINTRKKQVTAATNADFKRRVEDWKKHGGSLAEGLANGFDSQKSTMYKTITNAITYAFSGAIAEMAKVQAVAEQTAAAVAGATTYPIPSAPGAKNTPDKKINWEVYRSNVMKNYYMNPFGTHPYGNPGVWGNTAPPNINKGATGPGRGATRTTQGHSETHVYNITGFSPDEALRALETKRAFRMKNRRR